MDRVKEIIHYGGMPTILENHPECAGLTLSKTFLEDELGKITVSDRPDLEPQHPARLETDSRLLAKLWKIALHDTEKNIVRTASGTYFGAGTDFPWVYTRDIAYSGLLGLNRLYPELIKTSLEHTRKLHLDLKFRVSKGYRVAGINVDWIEEELIEREYLRKYNTNSYIRRTDDVCWLWCAEDIADQGWQPDETWKWILQRGEECFKTLYDPFFDPTDGLYRGQATFVDIMGTGYPYGWDQGQCVRIKTTSTNALYHKALRAMSRACEKAGRVDESKSWTKRANSLKAAMLKELRRADGTFAYFKHEDGSLEEKRDSLGAAFVVLLDVVSGEDAVRALSGYPVTNAGVPLFQPFFPGEKCYHNHSAWPFADAFFIHALEKADGITRTELLLALLGRACRHDGTFHEYVDFRTAAAFIGTCIRADMRITRLTAGAGHDFLLKTTSTN
jgi:hypothetical protein